VLRLKIFPVVLGTGERLFGATSGKKPMRHLEHMFDSWPPLIEGEAHMHDKPAPRHRKAHHVGQKTVRFSDLSGEIIPSGDAVARIVIHEHPGLGDSPVEIEVLPDEARAIEKAALRVAVVDLFLPGGDEPRRVTTDVDSFDGLPLSRR
jgi:hypothetical protein